MDPERTIVLEKKPVPVKVAKTYNEPTQEVEPNMNTTKDKKNIDGNAVIELPFKEG